MRRDDRIAVIIGVGEVVDRPATLADAREPIALMAAALRRAEADAGVPLLARLDGLDIINEISWPYPDPCALLEATLGVKGVESTYHPVGGQTPMLAIHHAALAIQSGAWRVAAICGAEAQASVSAARKAGVPLDWSPCLSGFVPTRGGSYQQPVARDLDFATPAHVYPFYETATRAAWGQSFADAQAESATIWANNAAVARGREAAWIRRDISPDEIATPDAANRMIAWPYSKLMMANPSVNQGAAVLMCSLAVARDLGVAEDCIVHVLGGAAADEPRNYLARRTYARSPAMEWVLGQASGLLDRDGFDAVELYSCFPCVPKMARRALGLSADVPLSVAGGLTFFGAPLNNYMTHAAVALVQRLRDTGGTGLLYGQGEYVTKHHALVVSRDPSPTPLAEDYRRADDEPSAPVLDQDYRGIAMLEAHSILFDRGGDVRHGGAIVRTPDGGRVLARVPASDGETLARLMAPEEAVGMAGVVVTAPDAMAEWRAA